MTSNERESPEQIPHSTSSDEICEVDIPSTSKKSLRSRKSSRSSFKFTSNKIVGSCNCDELDLIECHLETKELWDKFYELGTEMIITKVGRRMFPTLRVKFTGPIVLSEHFTILMDILPIDEKRYRYAYHKSVWLVAGKADTRPPESLLIHPDSIVDGTALKNQSFSFERVKLSNDSDRRGLMTINSMHRYQPRIHLVRIKKGCEIPYSMKQLEAMEHKTYIFKETEFIAVTAYQNHLITQLKINCNPFAKGFRDAVRWTDYERENLNGTFYDRLNSYPPPPHQTIHTQPEQINHPNQIYQHQQPFYSFLNPFLLPPPTWSQQYYNLPSTSSPPPNLNYLGLFHSNAETYWRMLAYKEFCERTMGRSRSSERDDENKVTTNVIKDSE